jgi:hypothetical protein
LDSFAEDIFGTSMDVIRTSSKPSDYPAYTIILVITIIYTIGSGVLILDVIARMITLRLSFFYSKGICWVNLYDVLIIFADILTTIAAFTTALVNNLAKTNVGAKYFGALIVMRILFVIFPFNSSQFVGQNLQIKKIVKGLVKSWLTIFTIFLYLFVILYFYSILGNVIFDQSDSEAVNKIFIDLF